MGWHATTLIAGPWPHAREHGDAAGPAFAPCGGLKCGPGWRGPGCGAGAPADGYRGGGRADESGSSGESR